MTFSCRLPRQSSENPDCDLMYSPKVLSTSLQNLIVREGTTVTTNSSISVLLICRTTLVFMVYLDDYRTYCEGKADTVAVTTFTFVIFVNLVRVVHKSPYHPMERLIFLHRNNFLMSHPNITDSHPTPPGDYWSNFFRLHGNSVLHC